MCPFQFFFLVVKGAPTWPLDLTSICWCLIQSYLALSCDDVIVWLSCRYPDLVFHPLCPLSLTCSDQAAGGNGEILLRTIVLMTFHSAAPQGNLRVITSSRRARYKPCVCQESCPTYSGFLRPLLSSSCPQTLSV